MGKKVEYILRHTDTKEPIIVYDSEQTAINIAGYMNKKVGREKVEILKRVTITNKV